MTLDKHITDIAVYLSYITIYDRQHIELDCVLDETNTDYLLFTITERNTLQLSVHKQTYKDNAIYISIEEYALENFCQAINFDVNMLYDAQNYANSDCHTAQQTKEYIIKKYLKRA